MNLLRTIVWLFAALWLSIATAAEPDEEKEGGILGTGIVGTITGLGSIVVNGQTIKFDPGLAISDGVTAATADALAPGHTVAVVAQKEDGAWRAVSIRQVLPLVGPVTIDADGQLHVLGTQIVPPSGEEPPLSGDWVAVSGLWQDRQVVASRLERLASAQTARIEGSILDQAPGSPLVVGDTRIAGIVPQHAEIGDVVRAFGAASQGGLEATRLETGLFVPPSGEEPPLSGDWVAVSGLWQDRQVVASRLERLASAQTARIEGSILDQAPGSPLVVGDTRIAGIVPQHAEIGDVVRAFGAASQGGLEATRLETGLFLETPSVVLVEGYLSPPGPAGVYTLLGSNLIAFTQNPTMIDTRIRQFGCGRSGELDATLPADATTPGANIVEILDCEERP